MGHCFILRVYRYVSLTLLTDCNFTQGICADDDDDDGVMKLEEVEYVIATTVTLLLHCSIFTHKNKK